MKKKILVVLPILAITIISLFNYNQSKDNKVFYYALLNLEALASENGNGNGGGGEDGGTPVRDCVDSRYFFDRDSSSSSYTVCDSRTSHSMIYNCPGSDSRGSILSHVKMKCISN